MGIKYSVLMSVYKNEKSVFLKQSIQSMLNQTVKPAEFILIEDGPLTDELYKEIDYFVEKNKNLFTIIKLKKNLGLGPALAIGVKKNTITLQEWILMTYPPQQEWSPNWLNLRKINL